MLMISSYTIKVNSKEIVNIPNRFHLFLTSFLRVSGLVRKGGLWEGGVERIRSQSPRSSLTFPGE